MNEIINIVLLLLIYCVCIILSFAGDLIFIKMRLHNCNPVMAEIIYFDEISFIKGSCKVTIVNYLNNGSQQDAVILRAKKDKIGDKIQIVTDGNIAVRKNVAIKEGRSAGINIIFLIGLLIVGKYIIFNEEIICMFALATLLGVMLIIVILYPLFYKAYDSEIKEKLGWRK